MIKIPALEASERRTDVEIELSSIKFYSKGVNGIKFHRNIDRRFVNEIGVKIFLKNHTNVLQPIRVGGSIFNSDGENVVTWRAVDERMEGMSRREFAYPVSADEIDDLPSGEYRIYFYVNNERIWRGFGFTLR